MAKSTTIDRGPYTITLDGEDLFIFTPEHTFKDIAQWIFNEGGAEDVMYYLAELRGDDDD